MLLVRLDERSSEPKTRQIVTQIRSLIGDGTLRPGDALPSTRQLAASLGVHRSTVSVAYQELWALGFLELHPRACPRVRERAQIATGAGSKEPGLVDWDAIGSPASEAVRQVLTGFRTLGVASPDSDTIDFSVLDVDRRLLPVDRFRSCMGQVLREQGRNLLGYGDCAGYPPLRQYIADRLKTHGISATPAEVLITNGSQQALDLVFRMIAAPGRKVAVESPTYDWALPLMRFHGLVPLEIPLHRDGMDLAALEEALRNERPVLVYTMPSFQNPTGVSTSQSHREALLDLCERYRTPILEDGFDEEMKYFGRAVLPVKSMDRGKVVIYCGTFSKVLFPGMRVGWIVADPECIERLSAIRRFSELSPNLVAQAAFHEFCRRGYFDRHITMMHRVYRRRMQTLIEALRKHVSRQWADWEEPTGGYLAWLRLSAQLATPEDWSRHFASFGVKVALGKTFFASTVPGQQLRLSISRLNLEEISEGVERLASALSALEGGSHD
ncbi:MAG: PLP-dependent aminotransferase family protein [Bacillota bacterium]